MHPLRSTARWASGAALGAWLALAVAVLPAGEPPDRLVRVLLPVTAVTSAAVVVLRVVVQPVHRSVWALLAAGLSGYGLGFLVLFRVTSGEGAVLGLNLSDALSLLLYPCGYLGLVALSRASGARLGLLMACDSAVVLLTAAAVAVGFVGLEHPAVLQGGVLDVVYALAYPVGGFTLFVVCLSGLVASRASLDGRWVLLLLGLALMSVGDALYGLRVAAGTFRFGTGLDLLYTAGPLGVALAAWQAPRQGRAAAGHWPVSLLPCGSALVALGLLALDHSRRLATTATVLAVVAAAIAVLRTAGALRQERLLEQARQAVVTDSLTGIGNRRALLQQMDRRRQGQDGAHVLLVADLHLLEEIRESLGAHVAEEMLRQLAQRVRAFAPGSFAARLRGTSFGLLLRQQGAGAGHGAAAALRGVLEAPVVLEGHRLALFANVGAADQPLDAPAADGATEWLRRADVALRVSRTAPDRVGVHTPELDEQARSRLVRLSELREALTEDGDQIVVHYQGKHRPDDGRLCAAEALVRWQHPELGLLPPVAFLPLAEEAGLLPAITRAVLDRVLDDAATLLASRPDWQVAVNLCVDDLLDPSFADRVQQALHVRALPPRVLRLEVTETVVMTQPARVLESLRLLSATGIGLSLDDYGTGLASLSYLRDLPVDELKIDRAFVRDVLHDRDDALIVASTVSLAHGLGLTVVAEGAEDLPTVRRLGELGCDRVQGFALSRPTALDTLLAGAPLPGHRRARGHLGTGPPARRPADPAPEVAASCAWP